MTITDQTEAYCMALTWLWMPASWLARNGIQWANGQPNGLVIEIQTYSEWREGGE
jgi:hypothetical protein